jgi:hypothetical protein
MKRAQLSITTYELDEQSRSYQPILAHTFWGKDLEEAIGIAKSHLITDFFFSSSFVGEMLWKENSVLILRNSPKLLIPGDQRNLALLLQDLANEAFRINALHLSPLPKQEEKEFGELQVIENILLN